MPPEAMQRKIEALMRRGKGPRYTSLPERQIGDVCGGGEGIILGCVYETRVGKTIFITKTAKGAALHMLLVHEYAHYLYNWRH
jgi:hypothetical protein